MILKRVAAALRRQDWTSVAVEFLLVVLGVLLAFQISAWASEREARSERAAAIDRLLEETEQTVAYFRAGVQLQTELLADLDYALDQVQRGTALSADQARMTIGLQRILNAASPAPPSSVYDDLVASGALGQIGDAKLRTSIANYRATLAYHLRVVDYMRQRMPNFARHQSFRYLYAPREGGRVRLEVDFAGLMQDPELQELLALTAHDHLNLLQIRQRTLRDAAAMCLELGRVAGQRCDLNRPFRQLN